MKAGLLVLAVMLLAAAVGCDESTTPEEEGFVLEVTVTDATGQPLEGMAVWRQSHLEGTIPYPPSSDTAAVPPTSLYPVQNDSLRNAFPNPFNGLVFIRYETLDYRTAFLEVTDWRGHHVKMVVLHDVVPPGQHVVEWTQRDESDTKVLTGVYTLRLTLADTLDTPSILYTDELLCTAYDDFFSNCLYYGWTLGHTDENGFLSTRDLDFFPSLQGHGQQIGCDEQGDYNGVFSFSERVTIRVSTVPGAGDDWIYYMSRDIDLVDGPNHMEFVFAREDSMEVSEIY
jgi:hypothetical protein